MVNANWGRRCEQTVAGSIFLILPLPWRCISSYKICKDITLRSPFHRVYLVHYTPSLSNSNAHFSNSYAYPKWPWDPKSSSNRIVACTSHRMWYYVHPRDCSEPVAPERFLTSPCALSGVLPRRQPLTSLILMIMCSAKTCWSPSSRSCWNTRSALSKQCSSSVYPLFSRAVK